MIKLFADTASNLPVALNKKYNVNIIPLSYTMDGKEVIDRIEYTGDISVTDFELTYNGESVNNITEPIGTFLKIVPEGLPEGSQVTWTQDNPYVLSFVPHTNHCQVQLVGLGTANLTASFNGIKFKIAICNGRIS